MHSLISGFVISHLESTSHVSNSEFQYSCYSLGLSEAVYRVVRVLPKWKLRRQVHLWRGTNIDSIIGTTAVFMLPFQDYQAYSIKEDT